MAHDHEIYLILADTAVELRDLNALRKYAPTLEQLASRGNHRLYLAITCRAVGVRHRLAGEQAVAENHLREALGLVTKLGSRWQIGRTLFELGELHLTRSPEKAREYYHRRWVPLEEVQAMPDAERARLVLNEMN